MVSSLRHGRPLGGLLSALRTAEAERAGRARVADAGLTVGALDARLSDEAREGARFVLPEHGRKPPHASLPCDRFEVRRKLRVHVLRELFERVGDD